MKKWENTRWVLGMGAIFGGGYALMWLLDRLVGFPGSLAAIFLVWLLVSIGFDVAANRKAAK